MRWLVCGGRDYPDEKTLFATLTLLVVDRGWPSVVIEGEARGADTMAREWAEHFMIPVEKYPADWERYGRAAGFIRNRQMLSDGKPDLVVAFYDKPREESKGTADMVKQARAAGVETIEEDA